MPLFVAPEFRPTSAIISPYSFEAIGEIVAAMQQASPASATVPSTNLCIFVPFLIHEPATIAKVWWSNGATANGNIDVGCYDEAGNRLIAAGATAQGTVSVLQEVDVTDTLIRPGRFYMGINFTGATATLISITLPLGAAQAAGIVTQTGQTSLPNPATFANPGGAHTFLPNFGLAFRTLAA